MHWTEPATSDDPHAALEKTLWDAANQLWAGASLKPSEYSPTVLGLIFLRYADVRFAAVAEDLKPQPGTRRKIGPADFHAAGVIFLPDDARFSHLLSLPEGTQVGQAVNDAMRAIEKENPDLADVLPKNYHILESRTLASLLKTMASIPMDKGGDTFGLIYEYFLGKFAMSEGQKGGEFYTPTSIVRLIVEILEPYHGRILDPACGSGGMFIQSARFVEAHQKNPTAEISVHGQEGVTDTSRANHVIFIDARHIFRQLDRAHRDFTNAQLEFLANIVRLHRSQPCEFHHGSEPRIRELFSQPTTSRKGPKGGAATLAYQDVAGLCKAASLSEIEHQGWSLNPGRYVGVAKGDDLSDEDFKEKLAYLNEELESLNAEARDLEARIAENVAELLTA